MKRTSYLLFCVSALALMLLQPAYSVVAYNYVSFYQSTNFDYYTYGDFVPNAPLLWDYASSYYEFYNSWDDSGETFDAPYMNLTTVMTYDGFGPMYNQTGISPHGIPYYIWNYTKLTVPEGKAAPAKSGAVAGLAPLPVTAQLALLAMLVLPPRVTVKLNAVFPD